ncbi:hypothetical protein L345_05168, partial [Ophiophagus hannah]
AIKDETQQQKEKYALIGGPGALEVLCSVLHHSEAEYKNKKFKKFQNRIQGNISDQELDEQEVQEGSKERKRSP